mmetsp:Transcript_19301/g.65210  ORF Transcript_19301/g.65210 Transcript_19301/m.65210 type:complete len:420 (+) Transcript_19301:1401-2660(+)
MVTYAMQRDLPVAGYFGHSTCVTSQKGSKWRLTVAAVASEGRLRTNSFASLRPPSEKRRPRRNAKRRPNTCMPSAARRERVSNDPGHPNTSRSPKGLASPNRVPCSPEACLPGAGHGQLTGTWTSGQGPGQARVTRAGRPLRCRALPRDLGRGEEGRERFLKVFRRHDEPQVAGIVERSPACEAFAEAGQCGALADAAEVRARGAPGQCRHAAEQPARGIVERRLGELGFQYGLAVVLVGFGELDAGAEAARSEQGVVQVVDAVRGRNKRHPVRSMDAVHLDEQRPEDAVQRAFRSRVAAARGPERVQLVQQHHARRLLARERHDGTDVALRRAERRLQQAAAVDGHDAKAEHARLARHGARERRLARARLAVQHRAAPGSEAHGVVGPERQQRRLAQGSPSSVNVHAGEVEVGLFEVV